MKILLLLSFLVAVPAYADIAALDSYMRSQNIPIDGINSDGAISCSLCTDDQAAQAQNIFAASSVVINAPSPDPIGFAQVIKTSLGGVVGANALMKLYPAFFPAVQTLQWADVQALILDAKANNIINSDQYAAFQSAASQYNIPITLP